MLSSSINYTSHNSCSTTSISCSVFLLWCSMRGSNKKTLIIIEPTPSLICRIKIYSKKPHYHLLVPAFICCIKIHFICPFHRVPNRHLHPPSSPSDKQDHSILLTGASITIPSCLSGHTITPCPTLWLLPTFIIFTWIFHDSSFNLHPLHLDIQ